MMTDNEVTERGLGWQSKGAHLKLMHTNKGAERTALWGKFSCFGGELSHLGAHLK